MPFACSITGDQEWPRLPHHKRRDARGWPRGGGHTRVTAGAADVQVAMRARCIRDVLRVLDGEEVTLGYTSFRHPVEVKDPSDTDYTYLLMPVTSPA